MSLFSFFGFGKNKKAPEKANTPAPAIEVLPGFDADVIATLGAFSKLPLQKLPAIDSEDSCTIPGAFFNGYLALMTGKDDINGKALKLKQLYNGTQYRFFVFDGDDNSSGIGLILGSELDILRYRLTNAYNYDLSPDDVLAKIEDLDARLGVSIVGCGMDWIELRFDRLPADMDAFADEMYAFCPDSVDQGVGDIASLKQAIADMHGMYFWWD
ncbi:hypothetical protein AM493_13945 [Flavobacterium akiainvivens]|uniref:DUF4253 domain-containing protein n=1 Tax=Flavobacterium akiainvivens TaxID=1202724 RepID=A0A0M9VIU7_9FLAO|nr:DUF4253 domain-containing protein [Flavobacterium akiainvivens]KOS07012.1 hypothetical protein AM493_13945 [Flavobacterium akiainvivens]SFQ59220.1 protein of unknown function [Flavobacterium akiainvivens]